MRAAVGRIQDSGIGALCVEARPHKDFNGPRWFRDLGVILDECKKRGMKMWLLDGSHFFTGFANGEVKKHHPVLCKKYLSLKTLDFIGHMPDSGAILKYALRSPDDKILGIFLQRRTGFEELDVAESFDLTNQVQSIIIPEKPMWTPWGTYCPEPRERVRWYALTCRRERGA